MMPRGRGASRNKSPSRGSRASSENNRNGRSRGNDRNEGRNSMNSPNRQGCGRATRSMTKEITDFAEVHEVHEDDAVTLHPEGSLNLNSEDTEVIFEEGGDNINMQVSAYDGDSVSQDNQEREETEDGELSDENEPNEAENVNISDGDAECQQSAYEFVNENGDQDQDDDEVFLSHHGNNNKATVQTSARSRACIGEPAKSEELNFRDLEKDEKFMDDFVKYMQNRGFVQRQPQAQTYISGNTGQPQTSKWSLDPPKRKQGGGDRERYERFEGGKEKCKSKIVQNNKAILQPGMPNQQSPSEVMLYKRAV